jgi:hypothetical protein
MINESKTLGVTDGQGSKKQIQNKVPIPKTGRRVYSQRDREIVSERFRNQNEIFFCKKFCSYV